MTEKEKKDLWENIETVLIPDFSGQLTLEFKEGKLQVIRLCGERRENESTKEKG